MSWPFKSYKYNIPALNWHERLTTTYRHTPDIMDIERQAQHLLFVCDEFQKSHRYNVHLGDGKFKYTAFTEQKLALWKKVLGLETQAIALPYGLRSNAPAAFIRGDLYLVPPDVIISLDNLRGNTVQFNRKRVSLNIPTRKDVWDRLGQTTESNTQVNTVRAWMYVGNVDYWGDQLRSGCTIQIRKPESHRTIYRAKGLASGPLFLPVRLYEPKKNNPLLGTYYHFAPSEYNVV